MDSRWYVVRNRPTHALVAEPAATEQRERTSQPPIVMAHGMGVAAESLRSLADELAALGHRCFVPDQPGFGRSTEGDQPAPLDIPRLAGWIVDWMTVAGLERAAIFGNSVGAQIAADLAARFGERASAVLLIGPTMDPGARSVPAQVWRWLRNAPLDHASHGPGMLRAYREAGLHRIVRTIQYAVRDRIEEKLPHISAPTLLVAGSIDPIAPVEWVERACRLVPAGHLVVIAQAGHSMQGLAPGQLAREISAFLDAVAEGRAPRGCDPDTVVGEDQPDQRPAYLKQ